MLLAVGIISTGVFILDPRRWTQVQARRGGTGRLVGCSSTGRVCWERREGGDASQVFWQEARVLSGARSVRRELAGGIVPALAPASPQAAATTNPRHRCVDR